MAYWIHSGTMESIPALGYLLDYEHVREYISQWVQILTFVWLVSQISIQLNGC